MKKLYFILLVSFAFARVKAQEGVLFKIKYLPRHVYESNVTIDLSMEINLAADSVEMKKIKESGIKLPMMLSNVSEMHTNTTTSNLDNENSLPLEIKYVNVTSKKTMNGVETPGAPNPIVGKSIYAKINGDGKMTLDSVSGRAIDEKSRKVFTGLLDQMFNEIEFPEKTMSVGDSFTQIVPFNFPIPGINAEMNIKTIYRLTAIENNFAYFDLIQSINLNMTTVKYSNEIGGNGTGKLIYNIENKFPTALKSNFDISFKVSAGNRTMMGKGKVVTERQTKISSNTN